MRRQGRTGLALNRPWSFAPRNRKASADDSSSKPPGNGIGKGRGLAGGSNCGPFGTIVMLPAFAPARSVTGSGTDSRKTVPAVVSVALESPMADASPRMVLVDINEMLPPCSEIETFPPGAGNVPFASTFGAETERLPACAIPEGTNVNVSGLVRKRELCRALGAPRTPVCFRAIRVPSGAVPPKLTLTPSSISSPVISN